MNAHSLTSLYTTILIYSLIHLLSYFRFINWHGWSYTGGYKQDERNGKGEDKYPDGSREIAYYVDGYKEGAAKYYDENGQEEDRFYIDGKLVK